MLIVKQLFLKCFYENKINLNIAMISVPGREFFSTNFSQFPLSFME